MIKLELECTPEQLRGIADVMDGKAPTIEVDGTIIQNMDDIMPVKFEEKGELDEPSKREVFDAWWETEVAAKRADEMNSPKYDKRYLQWVEGGYPELTELSYAAVIFNDTEVFRDPAVVYREADALATAAFSNDAASIANENKDRFEQPTSILTQPAGVDLDANNLPWDARIHGKAKKKNADSTWKYIKGVDREVLVPQVEAELREALAAAPKPAEGAENPLTVANVAGAATASSVVPAPPLSPNVPASVAAPIPSTTTFQELLPLVTAAKNAGTLTDAQIEAACQELGLAKFGLIATRNDLVPRAAELLGV